MRGAAIDDDGWPRHHAAMPARPVSTPPVRLRLLGGFEARGPGAVPLALTTRKAQALLAFFATAPGRLYSRDKLAALLWGDRADRQARDSLRHTLVEVRKAFPPGARALLTDGRAVGLDPAAAEIDVTAFERGVAAGTPDALADAADLYAGDLLDGFVVRESAFDDWLTAERERLRGLALDALRRVLEHRSRADRPEHAIATATRLLALDPLEEPVHRAVMRLYARQGRRAAALRQYQDCVAHLQRELRVEPEAETQRLYRELLRESAPADAGAAPARHVPGGPGPMVGRDTELGTLRAVLGTAWSGRGRVALALGDAGVGKSRLLEAVGAEWRRGAGASSPAAPTRPSRSCRSRRGSPPCGWWTTTPCVRPSTTSIPSGGASWPGSFPRWARSKARGPGRRRIHCASSKASPCCSRGSRRASRRRSCSRTCTGPTR
jgi:DNA-binding SARP family transcriptional activator